MANKGTAGKILELSETLSLPSRHRNQYFENRHWELRCHPLPGRQPADIATWLPYVEEGALALLFDEKSVKPLLQQFPQLPTAVHWLEAADCLIHEKGEWWPRLLLFNSLHDLVIQEAPELDISLGAYIIGAGNKGRAAAAAAANLGFSQIVLVDEDEAKLKSEATFLKRYLLGVNIEQVPAQSLTMQTKAGGLMLNTLSLAEGSNLLKDLSYFNFMDRGGLVVDVSECCHKNILLEEAERADLQVLSGLEVQCHWDVELIKKILPDQYVTYEDYLESFSDHLPNLKNSPSV